MNRELRLVLATHVAFYVRHPWLFLLFLLGLSLGSGLITAIAGLNQETQNRYETTSSLVGNPVTHLIKPLTGQEYIDGEIWLSLRRQGILQAQPVLQGRIKIKHGRTLAIQGIDTLLWLNNSQYQQTNSNNEQDYDQDLFSTILVDNQFKSRLMEKPGKLAGFNFDNKQRQPDITFAENIGLWALTDLAHADYLLNAKGRLSFIELTGLTPAELVVVNEIIQGQAQLVDSQQQDFDLLSDAFFFNLTALALLGYIVAAFLSFNAIKLTVVARKKLLEQMHLLGCTTNTIKVALAIELITLSLVTALLGTVAGYVIANGLVLDVNRTLVGLYELEKALVIHWQWSNVLLGFLLNISALGFILVSQSQHLIKNTNTLFYGCLFVTTIALIALLKMAQTEFQALLLCFAILVLFILLVPKVLTRLFSLPMSINNPLLQWLHADTRFYLKDIQIAIIAILVALGSAIGMQIMVKSFSDTLNGHLERQLSADIYLRFDGPDPNLREQLSQREEVKQLSIYLQSEGRVDGLPATLASFGNDFNHYSHIQLTNGKYADANAFSESGCLLNEQSKIRYGITINSPISFTQDSTRFTCRVSGFFYDYGNPKISLLTLEQRHRFSNMHTKSYGFSIRLHNKDDLAHFSEVLVEQYNRDSTQIIPNQTFKRFANELFNNTFTVTKALNGFILAIALVSLCTSLLSLSANQLKQMQILCNLGVTTTQLLVMKLVQTTTLIAFTTLFAVPLGFALGFALLKFVMPVAFGWTIHFALDLPSLLMTCLILILVSAVCAYLPTRRLTTKKLKEA